MASRRSTAPAKAAETNEAPEVEENELEYAHYLDKQPTAVHELCKEWLDERTGYDLDLKTIQIVLSLYGKFQRSEENKADIAERRAAAQVAKAEREKAAQARADKAPEEKPVRTSSRRAAAADGAEEGDSAPRARRGRPAKVAEAPAPVRRAGGRRRPSASDELED